MKTTTLRLLLIAMVSTLALTMAGCKGESSPTAPPNTSTVPPSGGVTPPTGATITLAVSPSATPLVSSRVTITATVTENGQPVTDGTAVQFTSTAGTFQDTGQNTTIRTTTNGVATAVLSSSSAGPATITATVNNVSKTTTVTFTTQPVTPPPPNTTPTITSICVQTGSTCTTPATGIPQGGQQVIITGTNFRAPVRVLFDPGNGQPAKEAFVVSVSPTQIVAIVPPFDIITGQTLPVSIIVITEAGTATEQKVTSQNAFTYQLTVLTPSVRTLTPSSGPIDGGTRVTILGDAFQAPVQVFFGAAEAQIISVKFDEIIVMSPTARDTSPNASGPVTGPVNILVRNVGSGKEATFPAGFRYIAKMQITAAGPTVGPISGGTRVQIDGTGFNDPVTVVIGGVTAQVIKVSGTQIIAITAPLLATSCGNSSGPITVTNVDNGDQADGPTFTYQIVKPLIAGTGGATTLGGSTSVTVLNALGTPRITIGGIPAPVTGTVTNPDGSVTYTIQVPTTLQLTTAACPSVPGVTAQQPTTFPISYTSLQTGCTDTLANAILVNPAGPILAVSPAGGFQPFVATAAVPPSGSDPGSPAVPAPTQTLTITNSGSGTLQVTSVTPGSGCGNFTFNTPTLPGLLGACDPFPIIAGFNRVTTSSPPTDFCTVVINTNAGTRTFTLTGTVR